MKQTPATWGSAYQDPNTSLIPSCSRRPPGQPLPCPPCWTTRSLPPPSTNCLTNSSNPSSSTGLNSGCPTSTQEKWPRWGWPRPSLPQTPSYPRSRSGRTWHTHITPYIPRLQYWELELRWGCTPTYIPATIQLTKYLAYLLESPNPIIQKAILLRKAMASRSKFTWWSNAWRLVADFDITEATIYAKNTKSLKDNLQGTYRRWWIKFMLVPTNMPKLRTFWKFHSSFYMAPYLNKGPVYLRAQALHLRCSNHRLDFELGRHSHTPLEPVGSVTLEA